jgi:hypothetical protein
MLRIATRRPSFRRTSRRSAWMTIFGAICGTMFSGRAALAEVTGKLAPILAQETSGEGGYPIIEWAIVVALVGAALFVICRSSRRN